MKVRTKSTLLLGATLAVGLLIGAVTTGSIVNHRLDELKALRNQGSFSDRLEQMIEPTDEAQRARIRAALERTEAHFDQARRECRGLYGAGIDSMRADLAPILTPAQQTRLDEWLSRDRRSSKKQRGRSSQSHKRNGAPSP